MKFKITGAFDAISEAVDEYKEKTGKDPKKIFISQAMKIALANELGPKFGCAQIKTFDGIPLVVFREIKEFDFFVCGEEAVFKPWLDLSNSPDDYSENLKGAIFDFESINKNKEIKAIFVNEDFEIKLKLDAAFWIQNAAQIFCNGVDYKGTFYGYPLYSSKEILDGEIYIAYEWR